MKLCDMRTRVFKETMQNDEHASFDFDEFRLRREYFLLNASMHTFHFLSHSTLKSIKAIKDQP